MSACANTLVLLLLTEKWSDCIIYFPIFCFRFMLTPLQTINSDITKAIGRSDWVLKNTMLSKGFDLVITIVTVFCFHDVTIVALGMAVYAIAAVIINLYPNKVLIQYTFTEFIRDIFPPIIISIGMGIIVSFCGKVSFPLLGKLLFQIVIGIITYTGFSWIFQKKEVLFMIAFLKQIKNKK